MNQSSAPATWVLALRHSSPYPADFLEWSQEFSKSWFRLSNMKILSQSNTEKWGKLKWGFLFVVHSCQEAITQTTTCVELSGNIVPCIEALITQIPLSEGATGASTAEKTESLASSISCCVKSPDLAQLTAFSKDWSVSIEFGSLGNPKSLIFNYFTRGQTVVSINSFSTVF